MTPPCDHLRAQCFEKQLGYCTKVTWRVRGARESVDLWFITPCYAVKKDAINSKKILQICPRRVTVVYLRIRPASRPSLALAGGMDLIFRLLPQLLSATIHQDNFVAGGVKEEACQKREKRIKHT